MSTILRDDRPQQAIDAVQQPAKGLSLRRNLQPTTGSIRRGSTSTHTRRPMMALPCWTASATGWGIY
jgi:hypothetical protein